jgi:hypothetical protein
MLQDHAEHHSGIRFAGRERQTVPAWNGVSANDERERTVHALNMHGSAQQQQHSNDH